MGTHVVPDINRLVFCDARFRRLPGRCGVGDWDWEDCVQEAYLALLVGHPDWTVDEPRAWAWLRRVARNKAVDIRRGLQRHPHRSLDERTFNPRGVRGPDLPYKDVALYGMCITKGGTDRQVNDCSNPVLGGNCCASVSGQCSGYQWGYPFTGRLGKSCIYYGDLCSNFQQCGSATWYIVPCR